MLCKQERIVFQDWIGPPAFRPLPRVATTLHFFRGSRQPASANAWRAVVDTTGSQRVNVQCAPDFLDPKEIVVKADQSLQITARETANLNADVLAVHVPGVIDLFKQHSVLKRPSPRTTADTRGSVSPTGRRIRKQSP